MKDGLNPNKMNSLARSNASLYAKQQAGAGGQEELYDRLRRHAYHKKSGTLYKV